EVKPVHADGTASSGRVGSRPLLINVRKPPAEMARRLSSFPRSGLLRVSLHSFLMNISTVIFLLFRCNHPKQADFYTPFLIVNFAVENSICQNQFVF
ncbi:MAG: hypothetical protein PUB50_05530, partial [Prevotella copri]|nr:hypothetical protein [Segatella copri]